MARNLDEQPLMHDAVALGGLTLCTQASAAERNYAMVASVAWTAPHGVITACSDKRGSLRESSNVSFDIEPSGQMAMI